jgi:hypothetical protein
MISKIVQPSKSLTTPATDQVAADRVNLEGEMME